MSALHRRPPVRAGLVLLLLSAPAQAQFSRNAADVPSGSPFNNSSSENVDFADVDLDGDWDAVFADGGDDILDQNRLWINQGGAQGGILGVFVDRTSTQFPTVSDQSRDIEFADIDGDGDADLYVSNTSDIANVSNRWWINMGGAQGGTVGFFEDQTATRWIGIGQAGSSVAPSLTLATGGFIDWSCDCDFGDLDNDGDLDLVHSTYGDEFNGNVPTRIFLNDGGGNFQEFNPSGFQLTGSEIQNGNPGLWCDGLQQNGTSDTTGAFCDIAMEALDIDLGDIDGDFDLDILHGARDSQPRMFANRLESSALAPEAGGDALGFRDVTRTAFPPGWSTGLGHYEQEMGDLDGDGDLDIYGLNWLAGTSIFGPFHDVTLENDGTGHFMNRTQLATSHDDDNEGDFLDYDNDGDLDLFVANFTNATTNDRLYRNNLDGGTSFSFTYLSGAVTGFSRTSLDADACDVDGDGDYDVFIAADDFDSNVFLENVTNVADSHPPYLPSLESVADRAPGPDATVVRVHVYDNAPYYITFYNPTSLHYTVDGGPEAVVPMVSSGGQVFRGEIPGTVVGTVTYWAESSDEYGNLGVSSARSYDAFVPGSIGSNYCDTNPNSTGSPGHVFATGSNRVATNSLTLHAEDLPQSSFGFFLTSLDRGQIPNPGGSQGNLCLSGAIGRYVGPGQIQDSGATGSVQLLVDLANHPQPTGSVSVLVGDVWNFTYWFRDANPTATSNLTDGLAITFR